MNANRVVATRIALARKEKGWTQKQVVKVLAEHGVNWSVVTYSGVERSVVHGRRNFSADLIVIFARIYGKPVGWFFDDERPPPPTCPTCGKPL